MRPFRFVLLSLLHLSVVTGCATSSPEKTSAPAAAAPVSTDDVVTELIEISGLSLHVSQIGPSMELQFSRAAGGAEPALMQKTVEIMREAFAMQALKKALHAHLVAHADRVQLDATMAWLKSPLGKKLTDAEVASAKEEANAAKEAWFQQLNSNPPSQSRVTLIQKVDETTGTTASVVDSMTAVLRPIMLAAAVRRSGVSPQTYEGVDQQVAQVKAGLHPKMAPGVFQHMLFSYRDISDEELNKYIAFAQSPAGRWYHDAVRAALAAALEEAGKDFANRLAALVDKTG